MNLCVSLLCSLLHSWMSNIWSKDSVFIISLLMASFLCFTSFGLSRQEPSPENWTPVSAQRLEVQSILLFHQLFKQHGSQAGCAEIINTAHRCAICCTGTIWWIHTPSNCVNVKFESLTPLWGNSGWSLLGGDWSVQLFLHWTPAEKHNSLEAGTEILKASLN